MGGILLRRGDREDVKDTQVSWKAREEGFTVENSVG
jgi:hypothetical protein